MVLRVSFPKMAGEELQIDSSSRFFHAKFKLEGSVDQPAYVGLALKNQDTGLSTVFVPKFKSGEYSLKLKYTHPVFAQAVPGNGLGSHSWVTLRHVYTGFDRQILSSPCGQRPYAGECVRLEDL